MSVSVRAASFAKPPCNNEIASSAKAASSSSSCADSNGVNAVGVSKSNKESDNIDALCKKIPQNGQVIVQNMDGDNGQSKHDIADNGQIIIQNINDAGDGDDEAETELHSNQFVLSPAVPLKTQLDKDKEDESLRKWKEKLLGCIQLDAIEDGVDPELRLLNLSIISEGKPRISIDLNNNNNNGHGPKGSTKKRLFTLKEGTPYNLNFTFSLRRNIVSGLTYIHTVWKNGIRVDHNQVMLGTFAPQVEPHSVTMDEEVTPSGLFARGSYTAKTKFIDDDGRCYFEMEHTFDIRKDW